MKKNYLRILTLGLSLTTHFYSVCTNAQEISCFAGAGLHQFADGQAACSFASFYAPSSAVFDKDGNMYITDTGNQLIRKVTPDGNVIKFAGSGKNGTTDGTGISASFYAPFGIAIDASGNLYVSDNNGHKIRKITPAGKVTTVAGSGERGSIDAIGIDAQFNNPQGLAIDASGNLYVADAGNNKIRKISPDGTVTTLAGSGVAGDVTGTGTAAAFSIPSYIAISASGNLYVTDRGNNKIKKITPDGVVTNVAGSFPFGFKDGVIADARFSTPIGITIDASDNIYITDNGNNAVRKISASGQVTTLAGTGPIFPDAESESPFNNPYGITMDGSGNLYVVDNNNHRIRKVSTTNNVTTFAGVEQSGLSDGPAAPPMFNYPAALTIDASDNIYVSDGLNNRIRKITPGGAVTTIAGGSSYGDANGSGTEARFYNPEGIVVDQSGNIYLADAFNNKIKKITPAGVVTTLAGSGSNGSKDGQGTAATFTRPTGITIDASGNLYVTDSQNNKIRKITADGTVSTIAGTGSQGSTNGPGASATFNAPKGIAVDATGNLYVADQDNSMIRKITPEGVVSDFIFIDNPYGIQINPSGGLYVTSAARNVLYKISKTGIIDLFAGGNAGYANGKGSVARFNYPSGIAVDSHGNLFIADRQNSRIRKIIMDPVVAGISESNDPNADQERTVIYPNPVQDKLNVKALPGSSYEIINLFGVILKDGVIDSSIDVAAINPGIYLLKIKTSQGTTLQQFVKE